MATFAPLILVESSLRVKFGLDGHICATVSGVKVSSPNVYKNQGFMMLPKVFNLIPSTNRVCVIIVFAAMESSKGKKAIYYGSSSQGHDRREYRQKGQEVMEIVLELKNMEDLVAYVKTIMLVWSTRTR